MKRRSAAVVLVAVLALAGSACGSDGSDGSGPTTTADASSATEVSSGRPDDLIQSCPDVGQNLERADLALEVVVEGTTCIDALELIQQVGRTHDVASGPRRFTSLGFDCTVEEAQGVEGRYACRNGAIAVAWSET